MPTRSSCSLAWRAALVIGLALLFLGATDADSRFNSLGHRLMCTCGCGQVLLECNHVGCTASEQMRGELRAAMARGASDRDILNGFVEKYGPVVLAAPPTTGFGRVAWIMPHLALVLGIGLTVAIIRIWKARQRPAPATPAVPASTTEMEALRRRVHEETEL
jgi:cytochrome c-type biogenesis protein CcmH